MKDRCGGDSHFKMIRGTDYRSRCSIFIGEPEKTRHTIGQIAPNHNHRIARGNPEETQLAKCTDSFQLFCVLVYHFKAKLEAVLERWSGCDARYAADKSHFNQTFRELKSMTTPNDVLNVARSYVGVKESPANSNRQMFGEWYGANGVAWCAIFVSYCFNKAGLRLPPIQSRKGFAYCQYGVDYLASIVGSATLCFSRWIQRRGRQLH